MMIFLVIIEIMLMILIGYDKLTENISKISNSLGIPLVLIFIIAAVIILGILIILIISSLKKKKREKDLAKPLPIYTTSSFNKESLPPKKDMANILLAMSREDECVLKDREKEFNLSKEQLNSYISLLCNEGYIKYTGYFPSPMGSIRHKYYQILPKGSKFLLDNGYLSKS